VSPLRVARYCADTAEAPMREALGAGGGVALASYDIQSLIASFAAAMLVIRLLAPKLQTAPWTP
jgi:hypothetical protein